MNYTPLQQVDALSIATPLITMAAAVLLGVSLTLFLSREDRTGTRNTFLILSGPALALVAIALVVYGLVTHSTPDARKDTYFREAATNLSETYGIEVTEQNIKEMNYPTEEQSERRYFGTTTVKTGPAVTDFITIRLAYDDGKVYLLKQVGEDYEGLKPVR